MTASKSRKLEGLAAHCLELFEPLGGVTPKLVFGEHAFFHDGVMFALIWDGALYVRADATTRAKHEALGLKPFVYVNRDGRGTQMPYFEVPPAALEEPSEMAEWARPAILAAHAASANKKPRAKSPGKPPTRRQPSKRPSPR
ncbi:MAG: TfoX/Sxy family protein [Myxococcota bacterium]